MAVELIVAGASMITAAAAVGGVFYTWRRNGKQQTARDERLELNQGNIISKLDDPKHGLTAINDRVNDMVNNCGKVSTGLEGRLRTAERDISELKGKH